MEDLDALVGIVESSRPTTRLRGASHGRRTHRADPAWRRLGAAAPAGAAGRLGGTTTATASPTQPTAVVATRLGRRSHLGSGRVRGWRGCGSAPAPPAAAPATTRPLLRSGRRPRRVATTAAGLVGEGVAAGVAPPSRPTAPAGVAAPNYRRRVGSARWVGRPWLAPSASSSSGETPRCQQGRQGRLAAQRCLDLPNHPELPCRWGASLAGELLQRLAHRVCRLVTAGSGALADRAAFQGDDPAVEAGPVGVDPDGVAAVAGRPEPVPPRRPCCRTAPWPWRDRIFRPSTVRFMEARSQGGSPPGPSWGRETAVNSGQSRCLTDNRTCSLSAVIGRDGAAGPYMACKRSELFPLSPRATFEPPATREPGQDSPHSLTPFRIPGERE